MWSIRELQFHFFFLRLGFAYLILAAPRRSDVFHHKTIYRTYLPPHLIFFQDFQSFNLSLKLQLSQ